MSAMKAAALLIILVINALIAALFSVLTDAGQGADHTRWYSGGWVALFFVFAAWLHSKGKYEAAILLSIATWPLSLLAIPPLQSASAYIARMKPLDPAFSQACLTAGVSYFAQPDGPVRSVALEWHRTPSEKRMEMDGNANVLASSSEPFLIGSHLDFVEERCCNALAKNVPRGTRYLRRTNDSWEGIDQLTADVVVFHDPTPRGVKADYTHAFMQMDVSVTDRRSKTKLANMRYFFDSEKNKTCAGPNIKLIDERAFILKAIGHPVP